MYEKQSGFVPIGGDQTLAGEFDAYACTHDFARFEHDGMKDWKGAGLQPIKADQALPHVDLPQQLKDLMAHFWKLATPSNPAVRSGVQRGNVQLAGARQAAFNGLKNNIGGASQAEVAGRGAYVKQVSPTEFAVPNDKLEQGKYLQGLATDWDLMNQMERINAYTFRGDKRTPMAIKAAGGFQPPATRNDRAYIEGAMYFQFSDYLSRRFQRELTKADFLKAFDTDAARRSADEKAVFKNFSVWRALADREAMHVGRMLANEALKGYTSTTKAVTVAKGFAESEGWVFLTLVKGGFVIPDKDKHAWTVLYGEQEIALPGGLDWADIHAFRQVGSNSKFKGPIYFRKGFATSNRSAFEQSHDLLSGKVQG